MTIVLQTVEFPTALLPWFALVLGSLLVSVALLTVGNSMRRARKRREQDRVQQSLRNELLGRLYGSDDPEWEAWVDSLSASDREELESLLGFYLRELRGSDAARLAELGPALGITDRSRRHIETGGYWKRLHALTWLALLRDPPDRELLMNHCRDTPRERAAAARILYLSETDDLATTGTTLLLGANPSSFSVFGIDTLYRVAESDPEPLFARATARYDEWVPALKQQVLLATRHLNTVSGSADLSWIIRSLSSPHERVRADAYRALGAYGWHHGLRAQVSLDSIVEDPSPIVRTSAYRMLSEWGDADALVALQSAAAAETDGRAQADAAVALYPHRHRLERDGADLLGDAWLWEAEHARFDTVARDISRRVERYTERLSGGQG